MMNTSSTMTTALIRAFYSAIIAGALAGLTASQQGSTDREAVIIGAIAALGILGTRGLVEGAYDTNRDANGDVRGSDVTPN
jgi:hypothetical protein